MNRLKFIIITGLSGAGKSIALHFFEDMGFFCIDNFLPSLLPNFAQICNKSGLNKTALVIDARGGKFFKKFSSGLKELQNHKIDYKIIFLEAKDAALIRRFSETRRKHPLARKGRISSGIKKERLILENIRKIADKIIDTTSLSPQQLKKEMLSNYCLEKPMKEINITIVTFGFKFGVPLDADLLFDVRFIPNPFYHKKLQSLTGLNKRVKNFVLKHREAGLFLKKLFNLIKFLIPYYIKEGKSNLTISIGCTGGKHRSIVIGKELNNFLNKLKYTTTLEHRDIKK